jgi:hypothetical protein
MGSAWVTSGQLAGLKGAFALVRTTKQSAALSSNTSSPPRWSMSPKELAGMLLAPMKGWEAGVEGMEGEGCASATGNLS